MGKNATRRLESHQDSGGVDPVLRAYRRTQHAIAQAKKYIREPNRELLEQAQRETLVAAEEFARALPVTRRGVALKAAAAYRSLRSNAEYGPVDEILRLFNSHTKVDGQWLHDLRALCASMEADGEYPALALQSLKSILESLTGPRKM